MLYFSSASMFHQLCRHAVLCSRMCRAVDVDALGAEEQRHHSEVAVLGRPHDRGPAVLIRRVHVDPLRSKQELAHRSVALNGRYSYHKT